MKLISFVFVLFLIVAPVSAQDTPASVDHVAVSELIVNTISGLAVAAFGSAPVTVALVALFKKLSIFDRFEARTLSFIVVCVLYTLALMASVFGVGIQFEGVLDFIARVAPAVTSLIGTLTVAPVIYAGAKAANVPVIGDERGVKAVRL